MMNEGCRQIHIVSPGITTRDDQVIPSAVFPKGKTQYDGHNQKCPAAAMVKASHEAKIGRRGEKEKRE
jgi:hypothetical protein